MPVTSTITIDGEARRIAVNQELYGLTIEEINHAIEGGIYAELIQNRSFEEGVPPLNCPFDPVRRVLRTPNGWTIPFLRADSVPGWRRFSATSYLYPDTKELINDKNRRSLLVSVSASAETGKGGIIAEGYKGISLRKGARYDLSFYIKTLSAYPKTVSFALADSSGETLLSEVFQVTPSYEWKKYGHTFTATDSTAKAVLTITTDSSALFWLDVVSLFPQQTWKGRANGMRPELMTHIEALHPRFIRFPGGSFAEGYTAGTYPIWHETIGDIASRKHFWNVWAYGSTNGVGFHEFLQLCEDLGAEPIYVVNSGITSQSRRPRYEDITKMDKLVQDALGAIAYANEPADSLIGSLRAKQGHPEPFNLKYIEIGSENYGQEYAKRFKLFKEAIREIYPDGRDCHQQFAASRHAAPGMGRRSLPLDRTLFDCQSQPLYPHKSVPTHSFRFYRRIWFDRRSNCGNDASRHQRSLLSYRSGKRARGGQRTGLRAGCREYAISIGPSASHRF